ncbi:MAG: hypothetical protein QNK92_16170 [Amylibacter sp.]
MTPVQRPTIPPEMIMSPNNATKVVLVITAVVIPVPVPTAVPPSAETKNYLSVGSMPKPCKVLNRMLTSALISLLEKSLFSSVNFLFLFIFMEVSKCFVAERRHKNGDE